MRINCIPVRLLTDQHLRAEWVEMLMLPHYIERSRNSKKGIRLTESIKYILNTGHATFFYNKLEYIMRRYQEIQIEMTARGYKTNPQLSFKHLGLTKEYYNDWFPTRADELVNLDRIEERVARKPRWYTYCGKKIEDWSRFYRNYKKELIEGVYYDR